MVEVIPPKAIPRSKMKSLLIDGCVQHESADLCFRPVKKGSAPTMFHTLLLFFTSIV